jgi:hypothetical protein
LAHSGLPLPVNETDICFPYYGDTLDQLAQGMSADEAAKIVIRGATLGAGEKDFARALAAEWSKRVTQQQMIEVAGPKVVERGPLQWEWFQSVLQALDRFVPFASSESIALFTHDVYQYLFSDAVQSVIDDGVAKAIGPGVETVVVSHSLGTVVAYRLLRKLGTQRGGRVPLFVTLGSPLGVEAIRNKLRSESVTRCPACAKAWFNAFDSRDVVALYPLDTGSFPLNPTTPAIENKEDVNNLTANRHGIAGYLDDAQVARRIYEAMTA